jgi:cytoskeletal protein CcmA (bactofilin family)
VAAVIDKQSEITGTLHSKGNVLVEGIFQGEIDAKETILVEKNARTQGKLLANDIIISGTSDGEIGCQHRLHITATASITGEVKTPILVVEDGSVVNCCFRMTRTGR